ncbi:hypothetical protein BBJ28_00011863 [Nothophytophthora sp. Chile5]|nr:hypothetical protein BBJ28_00011863 [Nothophytophthora sp. Chile5]
MEMEDVNMEPEPVPGFLVDRLRGTPDSREVLREVADRFRWMPENDMLLRGVRFRLVFLHDHVASLGPLNSLQPQYADILVRFLKLLRDKILLVRLAKMDTIVQMLRDLHRRIDEIFRSLDLADSKEMTQWESEWEGGCKSQRSKLTQLLLDTKDRKLVNDVKGGDKKVDELLMCFLVALDSKNLSEEERVLKQRTFDRVAGYRKVKGLHIFDWFIPIESVDFEDEAIDIGTFGVPRRGSWIHDGVRQDVVVKLLFEETGNSADELFLEQLAFWFNLPPHKNILKLHGGCHVNSPPFFVCENAHNGNLGDFFLDESNMPRFWFMFLQLAEGLKFLHDKKIVHGGLKCNNVLVGEDNTVKLADFNFSRIRSLSLGLSENGAKAQSVAVRWKPRELLNQCGSELPRLESDIYSLGMCMIEAHTQEPPFGFINDDEVPKKIDSGEIPSRPEELSDVEWEFISQLCAVDYSTRPTIDEVIVTIRTFGGQTAAGG